MKPLEGKTAIITGASRGIGRAIAETCAEKGANLALCARSLDGLQETAALCEPHGVQVKCYSVDANVEEEIKNMVDSVKNDFGSVDILVNNAGITKDGLLARMSVDDWDAVMNTNLRSTFIFSRAAARHMMKQRSGSIVNIASVVGLMGNPGQANYSASKGGMIAFTKSLAKELASRGIRANCIAPGFIETQMTDELSEEARQKLLDLIPLRKLGQPSEIAEVVAFFASDAASFITGQVLSVCGGMVTA